MRFGNAALWQRFAIDTPAAIETLRFGDASLWKCYAIETLRFRLSSLFFEWLKFFCQIILKEEPVGLIVW